jgi:putative FmdB family regulatory protein
MPTYEYKCLSCGNLFEYFQKITDEPIVKCENCGGELKRLISGGAGPIFKGTGFYQTDYKNPGNGKSEKSGSETKVKEEAKSEKISKE